MLDDHLVMWEFAQADTLAGNFARARLDLSSLIGTDQNDVIHQGDAVTTKHPP